MSIGCTLMTYFRVFILSFLPHFLFKREEKNENQKSIFLFFLLFASSSIFCHQFLSFFLSFEIKGERSLKIIAFHFLSYLYWEKEFGERKFMRVFFLISISDPRFPFFLLPFPSFKKKKRGRIERKGKREKQKN